MSHPLLPSEGDLETLFEEVKNWGRWGEDDELGTINLVTAESTMEAVALVESGRVVSIAHDLDTVQSTKNYNPVVHRMLLRSFQSAVTAIDEVSIVPHSFTVTHLDAVSHSNFGGVLYGGRNANTTIDRQGISSGSIHAIRSGIVTRGVLLDVAAVRGVSWLEPGDCVTEEDLDAAENLSGTEVRSGDVVLVHVGIDRMERETQVVALEPRAGLSPWCVRWLRDRDVSIYGGDCFERLPLPYETYPWAFHQIAQAAMGLVLLDNVAMEPLVDACREEGKREFMFTVAPLRLKGGTGSAVNPLAVF